MGDAFLTKTYARFFLREWLGISTAGVDAGIAQAAVALRDRWVQSGYTDYGIYADPVYIFDMVHCYYQRTRGSVSRTAQVLEGVEVRSVLDYYNGCGLSTIQAALLWPDADVAFFNDNPEQVRFMHDYADRFGVDVEIRQAREGEVFDVVLAFEVFEHYPQPQDVFEKKFEPRIGAFLSYSALFSEMWGGHFSKYHGMDAKGYPGVFAGFLARRGYDLVDVGFNNRPRIYKRRRS